MSRRRTMTISLPPAMIRDIEAVRRAEHRTRSELVREALRTYFTVRHTYTPDRVERRAIKAGRAALRRGDYVAFDDLRASLGAADKQGRRKKRPTRAAS